MHKLEDATKVLILDAGYKRPPSRHRTDFSDWTRLVCKKFIRISLQCEGFTLRVPFVVDDTFYALMRCFDFFTIDEDPELWRLWCSLLRYALRLQNGESWLQIFYGVSDQDQPDEVPARWSTTSKASTKYRDDRPNRFVRGAFIQNDVQGISNVICEISSPLGLRWFWDKESWRATDIIKRYGDGIIQPSSSDFEVIYRGVIQQISEHSLFLACRGLESVHRKPTPDGKSGDRARPETCLDRY
ncbi:hypothetical protein BKA67DRAFT_650063 [Truncatella angustata]|uniref:Uncharacterized protein n=1 Tax=Truncatella angustata TaxID=152316 RepID=A0A9P8RNR2_9PEZI|nr:uncharacterized protein BKA67DRAFT_650063 [Truncatella angustata]KAH6646845.1 hypothetical protein BKA67DRAFT_650063 [Truncatella angustata]